MLILGCKPIKESWPNCQNERKRYAFIFHGQLTRQFGEHFVIKNKGGVYYVGYPYDEQSANRAAEISINKPNFWDEIAKKEIGREY